MEEKEVQTNGALEEKDKELFEAIAKKKKQKKIRRWIIVGVILAIVVIAAVYGVRAGKKAVSAKVDSQSLTSFLSAEATSGNISTTVSGSGMLADVDSEDLTAPKGVEVTKVLVSTGDRLSAGDVIAEVELSSVMTAMSTLQGEINELDQQLTTACNDAVSTSLTCGVNGRVKAVYAEKGDDVAACMAENGALAVISLDGKMAGEIPAGNLAVEDTVLVRRSEGKDLTGAVETVKDGIATILVSDNGPQDGETVIILDENGKELGDAVLYIHSPLRITGYAGTISSVSAAVENRQVYAGTILFNLTDTAYSANYEAILKTRREKEEDLLELLNIYRAGAVVAAYDGTVSSVNYKESDNTASASVPTESYTDDYSYGGLSMLFGGGYSSYSGGSAVTGSNENDSNLTESGETKLITFAPDVEMKLIISVDEADILNLQIGQQAQVTVNSIGSDTVFPGTVTEINKTANSASGITTYSAVITMEKTPQMLSGMSAKALIRINGVDNAVLIPLEALHQTKDSTFVYTTFDEATKTLGGIVEVEAGISNNSLVEIISGLNEGDVVWYMQEMDWMSYYGFGYASDGDAEWIDEYATNGDVFYYATDGDSFFATDGDAA